jgi:hypothetical protein
MIRALLIRFFSRTRLQARFRYMTVPENPVFIRPVGWLCRLLPRLVDVPEAAYGFQFYLETRIPLAVGGKVKVLEDLTALPGRFFPSGCTEGGQVIDRFGGRHTAEKGDRLL